MCRTQWVVELSQLDRDSEQLERLNCCKILLLLLDRFVGIVSGEVLAPMET